MRSEFWLIVFGLLLFSTATSAADEREALHGNWSIIEIRGVEVLKNTMPSLLFNPQGSLSATAGCNRMSGSFEIDSEELTIGQIAATRMMCPEPLMTQEAKLIEVLEITRQFIVEEDKLTLLDAEDTQLLVATPNNEP